MLRKPGEDYNAVRRAGRRHDSLPAALACGRVADGGKGVPVTASRRARRTSLLPAPVVFCGDWLGLGGGPHTNIFRSSRLSIFPTPLTGSSFMNAMVLGTL
jgi:hypothetical protein